MVETDWKEILNLSQRELTLSDKELLGESLCWMDADDIELNFTDLKTLFRLSQDILKHKTEQVNNLLGQIETSQRKTGKMKVKSSSESPTQSNDSALETISHQEEIIRANKEILEQLNEDIAELEGRKSKLEESNMDIDSESSRDMLSEMNAVAELEREITMKNKHIRKLLSDVKVLEEENLKLKEKVCVLKDKLTEATQLINNLTEQLFGINKECSHLKDLLGKSEEEKVHLSIQVEGLRKEKKVQKESGRVNIYEEIKTKVQHWKNIAKSKKAEVEALSTENRQLKEDLMTANRPTSSPQEDTIDKNAIKELQEKLLEASNEINRSAYLINILKTENSKLKAIIEEPPETSLSELRNESDDGKERGLINKLRRKVNNLTIHLQGAEEMIAVREKELTEITAQLQLLRSDEGINSLIEGVKTKKRQIKLKDDGIKALVHDVNILNQLINDLQLENESLRQRFNVQLDEKVETTGVLKHYYDLQNTNVKLIKEQKKLENEVIDLKLINRNIGLENSKMEMLLKKHGLSEESELNTEQLEISSAGEPSRMTTENSKLINSATDTKINSDVQAIIEENKGLRNGLQEILDLLKDNSKTSSGILTLECPTLEAVLISMEARNSAGWFAPHMSTILELRAAIGGKDALLTALHEARKETYDVMSQLSKETERNTELKKRLSDIEKTKNEKEAYENLMQQNNQDIFEFGSWMSEKEQMSINVYDLNQIEHYVQKGNNLYELQLKKGLEYLYKKFGALYDRITSITVQATDDSNKWAIQEEQYKAEIENLRGQLLQEEEDSSDNSPGLMPIHSINSLHRKCLYLEKMYTDIRTQNENMKNQILENRKDAMLVSSKYETQIQKLMLGIANVTDKLRCSIPFELFWKQNAVLNDITIKYRALLEDGHRSEGNKPVDHFHRFEEYKYDIINFILKEINATTLQSSEINLIIVNSTEHEIHKKKIELLNTEIENKNITSENLIKQNLELQEAQTKLVDKTLSSLSEQEIDLLREQQQKLIHENVILKEQCHHITSQLEIALMQLKDSQQRKISNDIEVNMLRHQILDLQSEGDNKAIIARLSGEILVAHLQASENFKRIERLNAALNKEKELRAETEDMLQAREKIFDIYTMRYKSKFRYLYEVMQELREQYLGALPLISVQNYLNSLEELFRKNHTVNEKLSELEDLRSNLIAKHAIFDQLLDISKNNCLVEEENCSHKLKYLMMESSNSRELEHISKKLKNLEISREELSRHCNHLEKTLVLVNQGFGQSNPVPNYEKKKNIVRDSNNLKVEELQSEDESDSIKSQTITLTKPKILPKHKGTRSNAVDTDTKIKTANAANSPIKINKIKQSLDVSAQTYLKDIEKKDEFTQTNLENDIQIELKNDIVNLKKDKDKTTKQLSEAQYLAFQRAEEVKTLNGEKLDLIYHVQKLKDLNLQQNSLNEKLHATIDELRKQVDELKINQTTATNQIRESVKEENKHLLLSLKQLENDKNSVTAEYKQLLNNEREDYSKSVQELHVKIMELQSKLDRQGSESSVTNGEAFKEVITKYTMKVSEFEDKCFKLQNKLDGCKSDLTTYQSEAERWKDLASERLIKMEQLNLQLEERHCQEVDSYKAENQHWLTKLSDMQREHMDLRTRLTEQKTIYIKQLGDKDTQIEQLRSVVNNLKTQIMNMHTLISVNDPSFDLSAIVEVDEATDILSQPSDRLELKFESIIDLHDLQDDVKFPVSSTSIWQEPIIERLRREKQIASKQNIILRRQIKVLASRERRARLDAQNLKNQVFRISTTGNKVATAETAALQNKVASLQAQLTSARRDTNSSIALWDKWKRAQQLADRWQARYEEKCQEVAKLESSQNMAKAAVARLEKEKRVLLSRLADIKSENQLSAIEKQDREIQEKSQQSKECEYSNALALPVSTQALLDRVEAQQRRIVALEIAEKGNEVLVSEYEKSLAEITSLKGQVLKLESTLLESQIRTPMKCANNAQPELDYWKSYCDMLKEENVQLTQKINSLENVPTTAHQHRVSDLEQTVLTLRGLVSKLQAEQKLGSSHKKIDSRPSSGRSVSEKGRTQLESHRIEIANLKRSLNDKDLLLEKSKEMLKIAAEREDELLRQNAYLHRQIEELTRPRGGFLSA